LYYYPYTDSIIAQKLTEPPAEGEWCQSEESYDIDLNTVIVGSVDESHNLMFRTVKPKPASELVRRLQELQAENDILGQTAAQLQLGNMQLNSTVDTLGAMAAQSQLDIIALKGGAS